MQENNEGDNPPTWRIPQAARPSMTRMDVFKRRLASTEKSIYKKICTRIKPRQYNDCVDKLLCQAIRIAGFNDNNINMKDNAEIFNAVERLLISTKARLITHTGLTTTQSSERHVIQDDSYGVDEVNVQEMLKNKRKLETDLLTTQPRCKFQKLSNSINLASGGEINLRSEFQIMRKIRDEVKSDGDGTNKNYCAYIDIEKCVGHILDRIKAVVDQFDNATMEEALCKGFFMMCADGARHESIPGEIKTVVSFSITFISTWLMSHGVFPSSSHHILVHLQEIGNENRYTMKNIMKYWFTDWDGVQQKFNIGHCPLYDLADCKALYCITQHTPWNASKSSYLLCKCKRGAGTNNSRYECLCWTKEEYINLRQKSQEQWDSREEIMQEMREVNEDENIVYDEKMHRDWVKNENNGVSHMGCLPANYDIKNIRFDVFHGTSNVTKSLL